METMDIAETASEETLRQRMDNHAQVFMSIVEKVGGGLPEQS